MNTNTLQIIVIDLVYQICNLAGYIRSCFIIYLFFILRLNHLLINEMISILIMIIEKT